MLAGRPRPARGFGSAHAAMDAMNDDVLGLVLERVDSHVSLIRAAAVCRRRRRAIADAAFLRRYRSLHAPAAAGYYHNPYTPCGAEGRTVFVPPSPSIVDARHFSLGFLPGGDEPWYVWDNRGSLLVLIDDSDPVSPVHIVCEPLTQRYRMIPLPPDSNRLDCLGPFLFDGEADEVGGCISMSNFRLLCLFNCNGVTLTSVFTVGSSWSEKKAAPLAPSISRSHILGRASGSWYFYIDDDSRTLFDLNGTTEGCDGKPRVIVAFDGTMKVFARLDSTEWALEKKIQLSEATCSLLGYPSSFSGYGISTGGVGFIILSQVFGEPWPFSVNLKTMESLSVRAPMATCFARMS